MASDRASFLTDTMSGPCGRRPPHVYTFGEIPRRDATPARTRGPRRVSRGDVGTTAENEVMVVRISLTDPERGIQATG